MCTKVTTMYVENTEILQLYEMEIKTLIIYRLALKQDIYICYIIYL
jgi:hypothetical protein